MKLIFSRKGFDSASGEGSSPILPDGRMISLPIPEPGTGVRYSELKLERDTSYLDLLSRLGFREFDEMSETHLDPDLVPDVLEREPGWRPMFGQCEAAQGHLSNQQVAVGDIFLFFGRFKPATARLTFESGKPVIHCLFGYFQIAAIQTIAPQTQPPSWGRRHPHFAIAGRPQNTVYFPTERLSLDPTLPGSGTFAYNDMLRLTRADARGCSEWELPPAFHPDHGKLSYHLDPSRWERNGKRVFLRSVGRGQEFVTGMTEAREAWLHELLAKTAIRGR